MPGGEASGQGQIGGRTDLGGLDVSLPLHVQQPLHVVGVGLHVPHPRGHTALLVAEGTAGELFTENLLCARHWGESGGSHRGSLCPHG